jgi:hypothetical protein
VNNLLIKPAVQVSEISNLARSTRSIPICELMEVL